MASSPLAPILAGPLSYLVVTQSIACCKVMANLALSVGNLALLCFTFVSIENPAIAVSSNIVLFSCSLAVNYIYGGLFGPFMDFNLDSILNRPSQWAKTAIKVVGLIALIGLSFWSLQPHISMNIKAVVLFTTWFASNLFGASWRKPLCAI